MLKKFLMAGVSVLLFAEGGEYYYMNGTKRVELHPLDEGVPRTRSAKAPRPFLLSDGEKVFVPNRIVVKFASEAAMEACREKYDMRPLKKAGGFYLFEVSTPEKALEVAKKLRLESGVLYVQPEIMKKRTLR
ncbi:S8 family serine peptidase [Hydrogenimonas sp.]